mgnify:CR=1 FL=1
MLKKYLADLHIHTCLSPCADDEMIPLNILNMAKISGTKILGICDHNSAKNLVAMLEAAKDYDTLVLPGMEVQSVEEVHLLCYFEDLDSCIAWEDIVYKHLPKIKNSPEIFGHQWIVDKNGDIVGEEEQMLITSTTMTVEVIYEQVKRLGGIFIPAHIDKRSYSLLGQLGFIPENIHPDALEYSRNATGEAIKQKFGLEDEYTLITSSDAHRLIDMVYQKTYFSINSLSFMEVKKALKGIGGREVLVK